MTAFTDLLGPTLKTKEGDKPTDTVLAGKTAVGLYFSAHWCPPCRGFTPQLAKAYTDAYKAKGMEIVFVSSDRDEDAFNEYYAEQPWVTLPYSARDLKAKLSKKYKVSGIPSFVILDGETAETITKDGRSAVSRDPGGNEYPWKPPTLWEALGDEVLDGTDGETIEVADLRKSAKYLGLYFSAHWCPPCRGFTPELIKAYKEHLKAKGLEVIFVSSDRDQKQFREYYAEMPWKAIPMGDKRKQLLSDMFEVEGIPTFVVVDAETGETITTDARSNVSSDPTGEEFPWRPPPVSNLSIGQGVGGINEETALCVLMDGCEDKKAATSAKEILTPIAEARKAAGESTLFFYAPTGGGPIEQIRKLTKIAVEPNKPSIVLLDIPDSGGYYVSSATEVTADGINKFLDEFKSGALERKQLG